MTVDQLTWATITEKLYDGAFAYIATGPRTSDDWRLDVLTIMGRRAADPRGWSVLDDCPAGYAEQGGEEPPYPFLPPSPEVLTGYLHEITPEAAAEQLIAMASPGCMLPASLMEFDESADELLTMARTLLSRFEPGATYRTNVGQAAGNRHPDFSSSFRSWHPMTVYNEDIGLVVVSDDEVGLFWTFAPEY
ncbi:hypothetical protein [Streptomyces sp. NPDC051219]|uniref:hypothetical protein n=1 Tax=Streptomyces sp. NPDC051219 TaxID=3155283 RepID=UPI00343264FB